MINRSFHHKLAMAPVALVMVVSAGAATDATPVLLAWHRPKLERTCSGQRDETISWLALVKDAVAQFRGLDGVAAVAMTTPLAVFAAPTQAVPPTLRLSRPARLAPIPHHLLDLPPPTLL